MLAPHSQTIQTWPSLLPPSSSPQRRCSSKKTSSAASTSVMARDATTNSAPQGTVAVGLVEHQKSRHGARLSISRVDWFRKRPEDVESTPPLYMAFDCLYLERRDLRPLTLRERRAELEAVVENDHTLIFPARRLTANGLQAWAQAVAAGYEGMVGKDESSPYKGGRTLSWLKVKQPNYREGERGWEPTGKS